MSPGRTPADPSPMPIAFVRVLPAQVGWLVSSSGTAEPTQHGDLEEAMATARGITQALSEGGRTTWLIVHDASGAVVERRAYRPDGPGEGAPVYRP